MAAGVTALDQVREALRAARGRHNWEHTDAALAALDRFEAEHVVFTRAQIREVLALGAHSDAKVIDLEAVLALIDGKLQG